MTVSQLRRSKTNVNVHAQCVFLLVEAFSVDYSAMNDGKRKRNARGCFMSDRYWLYITWIEKVVLE